MLLRLCTITNIIVVNHDNRDTALFREIGDQICSFPYLAGAFHLVGELI